MKLKVLMLSLFITWESSQASPIENQNPAINVMGPLVIGNPLEMDSNLSREQWATFETQLQAMKTAGVRAISTDIWWGLVERTDQSFNWRYYDRMSDAIIKAGLKWIPILSFHKCGGNVGDDCDIPIPDWIWGKLASKLGSDSYDVAKFMSEQGNLSSESVSVWASDEAIEDYVEMMVAFQNHFAAKVAFIDEINISLGPSGELRYPSYNSHDIEAGYPTRGALQSYSRLARASFKDYAIKKYGTVEAVARAWGEHFLQENDEIEPPYNPETFFEQQNHHRTQYGRDFLSWYHSSLVNHGEKILSAAIEILSAPSSSFSRIDIGAKIPGIHWRIGSYSNGEIQLSDRLAEISAGLITGTPESWVDSGSGRGYRSIINMFSKIADRSQTSRFVLHFTCLEMEDGRDSPEIGSLARSLVGWIEDEANLQRLHVKGENALGGSLSDPHAWEIMRSWLIQMDDSSGYQGLTILRIGEIYDNELALNQLKLTTNARKDSAN